MRIKGIWAKMASIVAVSWSLFQLYTAWTGFFDVMIPRSAHVAFALTLIFLLRPTWGRSVEDRLSILDLLLPILSVGIGVYIATNNARLVERTPFVDPLTSLDILFGLIAIILVLEGTRRMVGSPLSIFAALFILYSFLGPYLPGILSHRGTTFPKLVDVLYATPNGLFGTPTGVSVSYVFLFVLLSSFLREIGAAKLYSDLAFGICGRSRGGPAKAAVIASSLFGTISGSATANVVGTGTFTIPLMKRTGYKSDFAAAVEAIASTGGQIMPPVMGAAAFVMAELTGVSYWKICVAAIFPAILYYAAVYMMVDLEAARMGLKGLEREELPSIIRTLIRDGYLLLPLIVLVYFLAKGYSVDRAGLMAILACVGLSFLRKETRNPMVLLKALDSGARSATSVAIACACSGIIVGITIMTGLGLRFSSMILAFSGEQLIIALVLVALVCMVLGMGMPTTAAYITVAALGVPALLTLGVPTLAAHLFGFYFACISMVTPPVALAAYTAAGIAESNPMKTGFTATRLGIAAYIVPFMFVFGPPLLFKGSPGQIIWAVITASMGIWAIAGAAIGYMWGKMGYLERAMLLVGGSALIHYGVTTDIIGFILIATVTFRQGYFKIREGS